MGVAGWRKCGDDAMANMLEAYHRERNLDLTILADAERLAAALMEDSPHGEKLRNAWRVVAECMEDAQ